MSTCHVLENPHKATMTASVPNATAVRVSCVLHPAIQYCLKYGDT
jgi:hypothetical protein